MNENNKFIYSYSSQEKEEAEKIRKKYTEMPKEPSPLEQMRKLDKSVNSTATAVSIIVGIIGALIFGAGFSLILVWGGKSVAAGIITGIIGAIIVAVAYPTYLWCFKKKKSKIAPKITELGNQISKM